MVVDPLDPRSERYRTISDRSTIARRSAWDSSSPATGRATTCIRDQCGRRRVRLGSGAPHSDAGSIASAFLSRPLPMAADFAGCRRDGFSSVSTPTTTSTSTPTRSYTHDHGHGRASSRRRTRWSIGATTACTRSASRTPFIPTDASLTAPRRSTRSGGPPRQPATRKAPPPRRSWPRARPSLGVVVSGRPPVPAPGLGPTRGTAPSSATAPRATTTGTLRCDVTVSGRSMRHGHDVDLRLLDRVLETEVRDRFDHRNINLDVPEFADGRLIPTAKTSRGSSWDSCRRRWVPRRVTEVRVAEDATLWATVRATDG